MTTHILIIDDNPDDLEFYTELLREAKGEYTVHTAESGDEATKIFTDRTIHCTFIDYNLPEMNGLKILDALNDLGKGKVLPVVILTGEPNQSIQAEAARKGALDYLVKDITNSSEQLEATIKKIVDWAAYLNKEQSGVA